MLGYVWIVWICVRKCVWIEGRPATGGDVTAKGMVDSLRGGKKRGRRLGKGGKKGEKRKEHKKTVKWK